VDGDRGAPGIRGVPGVSFFFLRGCIHLRIFIHTYINPCIDVCIHGYMVDGDFGAQYIRGVLDPSSFLCVGM